eukprot:SAG11_NODE_32935_length_280_cov_0.569061_1_plen_32_part_01
MAAHGAASLDLHGFTQGLFEATCATSNNEASL